MPDHQEVLDAVFKRQLSIVREAGIEVPSLVLSELICLFETLAQSFHQKCNDFKGALRKQHEGSDVAKEKPGASLSGHALIYLQTPYPIVAACLLYSSRML